MWKLCLAIFFVSFYQLSLGQISEDFSENALPVKETIFFRSSVLMPSQTSAQLSTILYGSKLIKVSQYYLTGTYVFGQEQHQALGLQIHQKNRGNLISETSAKLAFRQFIKLNQKSKIGLSVNTGFYQISLDNTSVTSGGSDQSFDIDWSMAYQTKSWDVAAYFGNLPQPSVQLFDVLIPYDRYYGVYAEKEFEIAQYTNNVQLNLFWQSDQLQWRSTYEFQLFQHVLVGINGNNKTMGIYGAIQKISLGNWESHFHLGYAFPISNRTNTFLTPLQFQLTVEKKEKGN